jgi:branched-chain amino acid transport system permease protein
MNRWGTVAGIRWKMLELPGAGVWARIPIPGRYALLAAGVLLFGVLLRDSPYVMRVAVLALLYGSLTVSLNLVNGYAGLFSLGHAAFYGIGAYTSGLLAVRLGLPFPVTFLAAGVVAMLFGVLLSLPAVRLRGIYLAIVTLAFAEIVRLMLINMQWLTRGPFGLPGIPVPSLFGFSVTSDIGIFVLALLLLLVTIYVVERIMATRPGEALLAIREDEQAAAACGIDVFRYKVLAFATAAFLAGLAGSVYAHYTRFISPDSFTLNESFSVLAMLVFGGMGSTAGALLGATVLTAIPEFFRFAADYRMLVYGIILTLVMLVRPQGILGRSSFALEILDLRRPKGSDAGATSKTGVGH